MRFQSDALYPNPAAVAEDGTPSWVCKGAWADLISAANRIGEDIGVTDILLFGYDAGVALVGFFFLFDYAILQSTDNVIIVSVGWMFKIYGALMGLAVGIYLISQLFALGRRFLP